MTSDTDEIRRAIIAACLWMNASGLNQGTSGNVSVRDGSQMLITPSAVPYAEMDPEMIAAVALDEQDAWDGPKKPSSEWRFHRDLLRARPEFGAVVHTHSVHATALAMARRGIPAAHYMVAAFGGAVRCARYATFGTAALSRAVVAAMQDRSACLMANHGMLVAGPTLSRTLWLAEELETLARQYILSLSIGGPVMLDDAEIARNVALFRGYGAG